MKPVPKNWWSSGVDPSSLPTRAVQSDKWDRKDYRRMEAEAAELASANKALTEFAETGAPLMEDTFNSLHKAAPKLADATDIQPSHLVNRAVMAEAFDLPEHKSLRNYTRGDDVAAALAAASLEPDIETLLDREQILHQEAQKLQETMQQLASAMAEKVDLDELIDRWTEDPSEAPPEEEQQQAGERSEELESQISDLGEQAEDQGQSITEQLEQDGPSIRAHLAQALERAMNDAQQISAMTRSWGLEPGSMHRLPAEQRLELAKRLNTPRMRRISELFGPMRNLAMAEQMRKTNQAVDEVVAVTLGQELERVLPSELVKLGGPRESEFYRDFAEGKLPVYQLEGKDKVAKGAIILAEDGSGSMSGERELWAKAVMLTLLNIARKQKRAFHLIHFGSPGEYHCIDFATPTDYTVDKILEAAEIFFNSGTCFQTPIRAAVQRLELEHADKGHVDADIVFLSDGLCGVPDSFHTWFREQQDRLGFTLWGIIIGESKTSEPLWTLADHKVCDVKDLVANGTEVREIFGGV